MNALQRTWQGLQPRDRRILAIGAVLVVLMLGYVLLWRPLHTARDTWRERVALAQADVVWMRAVAQQIEGQAAPGPASAAPDTRSLLARADATAREAGLGSALLRVEPVADGQVRVYFEDVGFDALMRWVETLAATHGTRVAELSAQRASGVGRVDARLSLEERKR